MNTLLALLAGHYLMDFALQSDSMAQGKNRHNTPPGYKSEIHGPMSTVWPHWLTAHAACHGLAVGIILNPALGLVEFFLHWIIDFCKCDQRITVHVDQWFHIVCKLLLWRIFLF